MCVCVCVVHFLWAIIESVSHTLHLPYFPANACICADFLLILLHFCSRLQQIIWTVRVLFRLWSKSHIWKLLANFLPILRLKSKPNSIDNGTKTTYACSQRKGQQKHHPPRKCTQINGKSQLWIAYFYLVRKKIRKWDRVH